MHTAAPQPGAPITAGTVAFKHINRAMVFGGFSTFSLLYCVQPVMPLLADQFRLTPVQSSWILSISTLTLAISLIISSAISERVGRKPMMVSAVALAAIATVLCAFANDFFQLLALRAILGIALGGMPAVAIAYLGEEIEKTSLGFSIGLYIAGSAFGGMFGRLLAALLSDYFSWRVAFAVLGAAGLYAAWDFWRSLPPARNFHPSHQAWGALLTGARQHFADPGLAMLFGLAFLLMGCFVSLYNYLGYRLLAAPFNLSHSGMGAVSLLYLLGIASAVWVGRLVDRVGRRGVLWLVLMTMLCGLLLTLSQSLSIVIVGTAVFTFGFFAAHSVASSWVARRASAPKALASALYLFFYYLGSSLVGSCTGLLWAHDGWPAGRVPGDLQLLLQRHRADVRGCAAHGLHRQPYAGHHRGEADAGARPPGAARCAGDLLPEVLHPAPGGVARMAGRDVLGSGGASNGGAPSGGAPSGGASRGRASRGRASRGTVTPRRLALITGASSGIGAGLAAVFASRGFDLVVAARREDRLRALAAQLTAQHGARVEVVPADLALPEAPRLLCEELARRGLTIDVLVNSAGYGVPGAYEKTTWESQRALLQVTDLAMAELTHRLLPGMLVRGWGRVLNVASLVGFLPAPAGHTLYPASKALVILFSQALAEEVRGRGVHVTALCPGFTLTEFHDVTSTRPQVSKLPGFMWSTAEEVAAAGFEAVMAGVVICVPGRLNRVMRHVARLWPTGFAMFQRRFSWSFRKV